MKQRTGISSLLHGRGVRVIFSVFGCLAATIIASTSHGAVVPAGPELKLGTDAAFRRDQRVCATATGDFAVTWYSSDGGPVVQVFDKEGTPVSSEVLVPSGSSFTLDPRIACDANGGFVVAWSGQEKVWFRRFDSSAAPLGADVQANVGGRAFYPAVSVASDGTIAVAWRNNETGDNQLRVRQFDSSGVALGPTALAGWEGGWPGNLPSLAHGPAGNFALAVDGVARRFDAAGIPEGPTFAVGFDQNSVCFDGSGGSVIAGSTDPTQSIDREVLVQAYDALGAPVGSAVVVSMSATSVSPRPDIACAPDGGLAVTWFADESVFVRRFGPGFAPVSSDIPVPETREGLQSKSAVALSGDRLFLVWSDDTAAERIPLQVAGRAFCDDSQPDCRYFCPGFDPDVDDDGDGVPNGCDVCTNVGGSQDLPSDARAKLVVKSGGIRGRLSKLVWKGSLSLPANLTFADLVSRPVRLILKGPLGNAIDAVLDRGLGTGGWVANSATTKLKYSDFGSTPVRGIVRGKLTDRSNKTPGLVKFRFKGKSSNSYTYDLFYPVVSSDTDSRVIVVLGDQSAADAGECAEAQFGATQCTFKSATPAANLKCKQ